MYVELSWNTLIFAIEYRDLLSFIERSFMMLTYQSFMECNITLILILINVLMTTFLITTLTDDVMLILIMFKLCHCNQNGVKFV